MLEWLSANKDWITTLTSIGTMLVWLFYAQLLYSGYRRQRQPRILINRGVAGEGLDSPCLICNMSVEAVYIYFILVILETSEGPILAPVTDCEVDAMGDDTNNVLSARTRQGPVGSGKYLELLSYRLLLERAAREGGIELKNAKPVNTDIELRSLEFHVVCLYGSDRQPFGAVRRFNLRTSESGEISLVPHSIDTSHRTSLWYRRKIRHWLEHYTT